MSNIIDPKYKDADVVFLYNTLDRIADLLYEVRASNYGIDLEIDKELQNASIILKKMSKIDKDKLDYYYNEKKRWEELVELCRYPFKDLLDKFSPDLESIVRDAQKQACLSRVKHYEEKIRAIENGN